MAKADFDGRLRHDRLNVRGNINRRTAEGVNREMPLENQIAG